MYFFTGDEHFHHNNIIRYCNRPFKAVDEMDNKIIKRHNEVVKEDDIVVHAGDFSLIKDSGEVYDRYIRRLNGKHIFLKGSHDYWIPEEDSLKIWEQEIEGIYVVVCHYAMRAWPKSHYNSWQLFGHSHGKLKGVGKQIDIGVDTHGFYPYSFRQIKEIMSKKENNFNYIPK